MKALLLTPAVVFACLLTAPAEVDFVKEVLPVLETRCMDCHREAYKDPRRGRMKKPKSGYRMDTPELMVGAGDENEQNILAGKPEESPLYKYVMLPEEDDWAMPPKDERLTDAQKTALKNWITEGAKFGDWTGTQFTPEGEKIK